MRKRCYGFNRINKKNKTTKMIENNNELDQDIWKEIKEQFENLKLTKVVLIQMKLIREVLKICLG